MFRVLKLLLLLLVVLAGLALHARNAQPVELDYYLGLLRLPLSLLVALALLVGALLGVLAALPALAAWRHRCLRLERRLREREAPAAPLPAAAGEGGAPVRAQDAG